MLGGVKYALPECLPERFPEETGGRTGIMDADLNRAHPMNQLRPRLRSGKQRKMYKRMIVKYEYRSKMATEAHKQLALMNRCRMHKGGNGVANQPFYTTFLNR